MKINLIKGILTLVLTGLIVTACSKNDEPSFSNDDEPENIGPKDLCYIFDSSTKTATVTYSTEMEPSPSGENYPGLTAISIPSTIEHNDTIYTVTSIGDQAFVYCSGLTSINIPNSVTSIGGYAFMYCSGLTSITIPNSVTSIGGHAFIYCSGLTSITIPSSVTSMGSSPFDSCTGLNNIIVDENNLSYSSIDGVIYTKDLKTLVCYPPGREGSFEIPNTVTSIGDDAFVSCSGLTSITIPNSVTAIGVMAFNGCTELTSVTIGNSVTSIRSGAFYSCSGLTSINIPNSVTSIGGYAFYNCTELTSVTIGNSVTSIVVYAFANCDNLETIYCKPLTPPQADIDMFAYTVYSGAILNVPSESISMYKSTEPWSNFKNIVGVDKFPE